MKWASFIQSFAFLIMAWQLCSILQRILQKQSFLMKGEKLYFSCLWCQIGVIIRLWDFPRLLRRLRHHLSFRGKEMGLADEKAHNALSEQKPIFYISKHITNANAQFEGLFSKWIVCEFSWEAEKEEYNPFRTGSLRFRKGFMSILPILDSQKLAIITQI